MACVELPAAPVEIELKPTDVGETNIPGEQETRCNQCSSGRGTAL
jgi:hypothetical protein